MSGEVLVSVWESASLLNTHNNPRFQQPFHDRWEVEVRITFRFCFRILGCLKIMRFSVKFSGDFTKILGEITKIWVNVTNNLWGLTSLGAHC